MKCSRCGVRHVVKPTVMRKHGITAETYLCRKCFWKYGTRKVSPHDRSALKYLLELAKIRKLHLEAEVDDSA